MNQGCLDERIRRYGRALDFGAEQVRRLVTNHPDYFPLFSRNGKWKHDSEAWTNWCEGFLGGLLWIYAIRTGGKWWRRQAEHYSELIEHRQNDRTVHDLGFLFLPTWKVWFQQTNDAAKQEVVVQAGRTLALRFNPAGRYLRSFVAPESLFIDIMMNVPIIIEAGLLTGEQDLVEIGIEHCLTTRRFLVRGDGSTSHEGIFDPQSGEFLRQTTHQGWRNDSSWARGQAWALYGFSQVFELTGDARFLATAEQCAEFYIQRTSAHGVPPNDWEEPRSGFGERGPYESSAAAIAARGLWHLAAQVPNTAQCDRYQKYAYRILDTLCEPEFLATDTPGWEGVLKHGIYHQRKGLGVDESVMWGEYFFIDALDQVVGRGKGGEKRSEEREARNE
jgi:unsaturated chondroitin disaccharide hydrolase